MPSLALNSKSWSLMESEVVRGRFSARRIFRLKERNSNLRFAWSWAEGVARMVLALESRLESISLVSMVDSGGEDEATDLEVKEVESEVEEVDSEEGDSEDRDSEEGDSKDRDSEEGDSEEGEGDFEAEGETAVLATDFRLSLRAKRLSYLSLGAPVAKRTRSGSTWNMSPGFNW